MRVEQVSRCPKDSGRALYLDTCPSLGAVFHLTLCTQSYFISATWTPSACSASPSSATATTTTTTTSTVTGTTITGPTTPSSGGVLFLVFKSKTFDLAQTIFKECPM